MLLSCVLHIRYSLVSHLMCHIQTRTGSVATIRSSVAQADLPLWFWIIDHLSVIGHQAEPALLPDGAVAMHQQTLLVVHHSSRCQFHAL
jgi:hypothetical protein